MEKEGTMVPYITGKDSLAGKLKSRLLWWLIGAAGALLLAGLALGPSSAQAQVAGATYKGDIQGGGTVEITVSSDGQGISSVKLTGFVTYCTVVTQQSTQDPATPIEGGFFIATFQAGPAASPLYIGVFGQFTGATIDGAIGVGAIDPQCEQEPRTFTASQVAGAAATPSPTVAARALPSTGSGSDSAGAPWALLAGATAVLGLGAGVVLLRRRSTSRARTLAAPEQPARF